MPWIAAAIGAGGSLLGGVLGGESASDAARAQVKSGREAQNFAYQQYLTSLGLQEPWRATGQSALNELNQLFGYQTQPYQDARSLAQQNHAAGQAANNRIGAKAVLKMLKQGMNIKEIAGMGTLKSNPGVLKRLAKHGINANQIGMLQAGPYGQMQQQSQGASGPAPGGPDMSVFTASPDYQFRRDEGQRDLGNSFAARGGAFSGNALRGLSDFNQNLASGEFQNFINRRMALAGYGQQAAGQGAQASQQAGYQGANIIQNMGDARASGIANQGNMYGQAISGAANAYGQAYGNRNNAYDQYQYYGNQGWGY